MYKKVKNVICIESFETPFFCFKKNGIYFLSYNKNEISMTAENKKVFSFRSNSFFAKQLFPVHFIDIQEERKLKLEKINGIR
jgi:hypothetical protein